MNVYRNKLNGRVIAIPSELVSPDWERIGPAVNDVPEKAVKANERKNIRKSK